jgi:hypothetical protein
MQLSTAELARLELMVASGRVRSDPPTLSATDRMMDAMIHAARTKVKARMSPGRLTGNGQASEQIPSGASPAHQANATTVPLISSAPGELQVDWNTPRTLHELIRIRQALLRDEERNA